MILPVHKIANVFNLGVIDFNFLCRMLSFKICIQSDSGRKTMP